MKKKQISWILLLLLLFCAFSFGQVVPGTEALAASDSLPGFENTEYMFTSIDGDSVSTQSNEGQATVIVFGRTTCGNSQATVKNIAASSWVDSKDVRVIFAECDKAGREATRAFAQTYGCNAITFCYDENYYSQIYTAMWEYHDSIYGPAASGSLPFTVLIDGNNRVRNVLKGNQSANAIMSEIEKFSSVEYENPNVSIVVRGTENYDYIKDVLKLVNQSRTAKGLSTLTLDKELLETAMQRAAEISMYYSHTRPDGSSCFTASGRGTRKSENIAAGYSSPQAVMNAWLGSEGHYANIMDAEVTSIGVGCFVDSSGICHWVQFFDNDKAAEPVVLGSKDVTRTVSMGASLLSLQGGENQEFSCKDIDSKIQISISNVNREFAPSKPEILASNFEFVSSAPSVAEVDANGTVTLKGPGTAEITASLKSKPSISVKQTVTIKDDLAPGQPGGNNPGLEVSNVTGMKASSGADSIKLSWKKNAKANGYTVYQYNSSKKKWTKIGAVNENKASYTVKKLKTATGYRFAVKAYVLSDGKEISSKSYTSLYVSTKPQAVQFKVIAQKKKAVLKWNKVKGATGYTVYYKTSAKSSWKKLKTTKSRSYTRTKLTSGKQYIFTVKAYKTYKGKTYTSSFTSKKVRIK